MISTMYIYNIVENKLTQVVPTDIENRFDDILNTSDLGLYTDGGEYFTGLEAVKISENYYGYLKFYGWMLKDVKYFDGNIEYSLFDLALNNNLNGISSDLFSLLGKISNESIKGHMFEKYESGELVGSVLVDGIEKDLRSVECEFNEIIDGYMLSRGSSNFNKLNDIRIKLIDNTLTLDIDNIIYKYELDDDSVNAFNLIFRVSNFD